MFTWIKKAIEEVPTLYNPNFNKDLLIYTFASDTSLAAMLTHKDELNNERPISFMSGSLRGPEVNYHTVEKQAYTICNVVKHFKPYLLKNHCIVFVMHPSVRSLLVQQALGERREN